MQRTLVIGATGNKNRNVSLTPDTGGAITFNAVLRDNGAFQGGVEKHGHGVVALNGINIYTGGTTNTGGGTLLVNGSIGGASVQSTPIVRRSLATLTSSAARVSLMRAFAAWS